MRVPGPLRRATQALLLPAAAAGQAPPSALDALPGWVALDAPPAHEQLATDVVRRALPGWERDRLGNLILRKGSGRPRRVVACALDQPTLVVSQVTADGYLRLHKAGSVRQHPLWDQAHEAQQVRVLTRAGSLPGVVAIANGHFSRQHRGDTTVVTVDDLWVDVGARSREEVERLGISLLDPVVRDAPRWRVADHVTGPAAGARAGCAAVAAASRGEVRGGETLFLMTTHHAFGWAGLGAALAPLGAVDQVTVVESGEEEGGRRTVPMESLSRSLPRVPGADSVRLLVPRVRFAGTLVETIAARDADDLLARVAEAAGLASGARPAWVALPAEGPAMRPAAPADSLSEIEGLLRSLVELPGVPRHEARVREAVRAALPAWARAASTVDEAGNLVVSLGPDRDTTVVIAHLDEVAYEVTEIAPDGTVSLGRRGGVIPSAWEGQPALLHFDPERDGAPVRPSIPGVFVPRAAARVKSPGELTAWFGMDGAALAAAGVRPGMGVTGYKRGVRLAGTRFTARSLDDRAGSTALLLALREIDPARLPRKLLFVWSIGEEGGLVGAHAIAARLGPTVRRTYTVDTFVSSDTPLESPHFAYAPLGAGAVLRGLDDRSVTPRDERDRVLRLAREGAIPVQEGTTHGGTDGSALVYYGAPNVGLSWPGRYSHSPGEVLDLRDLRSLGRLIAAVSRAPE